MTYIAPLSPFGPPYVGGEGIPQLIKDRIYKLMGIEDSGWALICVEVKKTSHSTQNSKLGRLS